MPTILLVEDNEMNRDMLSRRLERKGYAVAIAVDGEAGLAHGMWQTIGCNSFPDGQGLSAVWQQGTYDNLYMREHGEWRILRMRWLANFRTRFDRGWVDEPLYQLAPLDWSQFPEAMRPDLPPSEAFESYDPTAVRRRAPSPPAKGQPISRPILADR